ncbi:uncharacterized protein N0V89_000490 [Didymosphaeria variabile]|uniref:Uncharacterized protein n=1 Tax=Didymosphaeria variabile TaxID=1932322 RepID=A0A9W9CFW8_9PLEO|nr:uncharacterized protein N0V89_000490 [Didymosphaeria variabile]KAJ4359931.1 hypothetical protein N0V89_000490 [Didymosphaeria variabile]
MYLPQCSHDNRDHFVRPNNFTSVISRAYARDEALKLAVIALGTAMLGKVQGEEEWMRQGRKLYGQALQETRKALLDANRVNSEALLLVPRIGALFEILFGADMDPIMQAQSWRSHAEGELAIIKARTPYGFQDDLSHQIYVDGRLPPIIAAIRIRKASVLDSVEWKTIPWDIYPKTPKDSLMDILVGIPEVLEDIDSLHPKFSDAIEAAARASIAIKCKKLETQLQYWATVHEWTLLHPDTEEPAEIAFSDILTAYLTLYYWTASLFVYGALAVVSPPKAVASPQALLTTSTDALLYARRIARSVPYFLNPSCGIWGATTISFPMGAALLCLIHNGKEENKAYLGLALAAWHNPALPCAIRDFLNSMRRDAAGELKYGRPRFGGELGIF